MDLSLHQCDSSRRSGCVTFVYDGVVTSLLKEHGKNRTRNSTSDDGNPCRLGCARTAHVIRHRCYSDKSVDQNVGRDGIVLV